MVVLLSEGAGNPVDFRFARTVMEWRPVTSVYHRNPSGNLRGEGERRPVDDKLANRPSRQARPLPMLTLEGLIAVIALCLTCFALGYTFGKDSTQKRR